MKRNPGREPTDDARMPFTAHLVELRARLTRSLLAIVVAFVVCFSYVEHLFRLLAAPILRIKTPGLTLIGTEVPEAFFTKLKVAFVAALFFASPAILWQGWRFIAPGLYESERRYARSFVFFGTLFFFLGAWFCYEVIFDLGYSFFLKRYQAIDVRPAIKVGEYLSFSSRLLLAFGIIFELPVVAFFLTRVGLIDHRFLLRQFRYATVAIFLLAAILTPPDIISQILLALPLATLYGVSIVVAYFARRRDSRS